MFDGSFIYFLCLLSSLSHNLLSFHTFPSTGVDDDGDPTFILVHRPCDDVERISVAAVRLLVYSSKLNI